MRRAARVDANQAAIVAALRAAGCSVQSLAAIGKGCPDILVGSRGLNWVLEIKDGAKRPSARRLTADEQEWHDSWCGTVLIVYTPRDALEAIGLVAA